ncbi:hypothetical protein EOA25_19130 [Mesorhizobium sp. M2A.F.Ca.ET.040.01.1.1]|nr:hypothetical protein EOA25_19130 [Mesorhizobium sp. M2A.F.Ca.ET.040.01.1.1]
MFNLIMRNVDWAGGAETMPIERIFEYTDDHIAALFRPNNVIDVDALIRLPTLFMQEGIRGELAYVGHLNRARIVGRDVSFDYTIEREVPALTNAYILENRAQFHMPHDFEFSRNHWAVKDVDLYQVLLRILRAPVRQRPAVFNLPEREAIDPQQASAMMPFAGGFEAVYASIEAAARSVGMRCNRADNIWEHHAIMQDIASLIDRSRIIAVDCTGRNPNVFYEAGIAHTLGREVILITQNAEDVPFDLRHLRYIHYHNNGEGVARLQGELEARMRFILGR